MRRLFEAAGVRQRVLDRETVEFTDVEGGTTRRVRGGIVVEGDYPGRLEVRTVRVGARDAYPQVRMLEELFGASARIGHHAEIG